MTPARGRSPPARAQGAAAHVPAPLEDSWCPRLPFFAAPSTRPKRHPNPAPPARGAWPRVRPAALPLGSLLLFLALWQLLAASGTWSETLVPRPVSVWDAFVDVSTTHDGTRGYNGTTLVEHLGISLRRIALGAGIGVIAGVVFGLLMGTVGWMRSLFEP